MSIFPSSKWFTQSTVFESVESGSFSHSPYSSVFFPSSVTSARWSTGSHPAHDTTPHSSLRPGTCWRQSCHRACSEKQYPPPVLYDFTMKAIPSIINNWFKRAILAPGGATEWHAKKNHAHEAFMRRGATRDAWGFRMNPQQSQCRRGKYIFRTASRSCPVRRSIMGSLISQPDHFLRLPVFSEPRISSW